MLGRWEHGEAAGVGLREIKESVCRSGKVWMVERCKAKAPLVAEVAQRVSWASVGCQHGLWNWMLQRNAGSGESDVSSW